MKKELPALTSFRFIAALAVVVPHFGYPTDTGGVAVGFFFALSGFILAYNYAEKFQRLSVASVAKLYALRIARIWPLHIAMFLAVIPLVIIKGVDYSKVDTLSNIFLLHAWFPNGEDIFSYNGVSWSISVELFFYLVLPFILFGFNSTGVSRSALKAGCALVLAAAVALAIAYVLRAKTPSYSAPWWFMNMSPYVRVFDFVMGICLGLAFNRLQDVPRTPFDLPVFTLFEALSLVFLAKLYFLPTHGWPTLRNSLYAEPAMLAIIFVFAFQRGALSYLVSNRVLKHFGEISFALYMVHQPIIMYADHFIGPTILIAKDIGQAWGQVLLSILMLALADCAYRYIEVPARNAVRALVAKTAALPNTPRTDEPVGGHRPA
ncbi:acyltransferase [Burkholderia multivorans]|uniref:acyltransferase family protein n=1 Tax=Burkholderia multivorans TaxID=87883 RepID=UPI001C2171E4|nr:acyltransferase [Burkholderia multivorans]MBU9660880.1 acyltransferase [Burkholderia multivorans]